MLEAFVVEVVGCGDGRIDAERPIAGPVRFLGHEIDDAAGGAKTLNGVGPVDHFDPFDGDEVDRVAVARAVARWVGLRHYFDQVERMATEDGRATGREREGRYV